LIILDIGLNISNIEYIGLNIIDYDGILWQAQAAERGGGGSRGGQMHRRPPIFRRFLGAQTTFFNKSSYILVARDWFLSPFAQGPGIYVGGLGQAIINGWADGSGPDDLVGEGAH